MFKTILSILFLSTFQSQAQTESAPRIDVQREFRANPIWYWKQSESSCVPVPSYDVIGRVGPQKIRNTKGLSDAKDCAITLKERQLIAVLSCDNKIVEQFYAKESLCSQVEGNVAKAKSRR